MKRMNWFRRIVSVVIAVTVAAVVLPQSPAQAAVSSVQWTSTNPGSGAAASYTWDFVLGTTGSVSTVTFTVPTGTVGASLSVNTYLGIGPGTVALSGTTVTYTVTTPVSLASGVEILISIDGFTNTSTAGTYTSNVTTTQDTAGTSGSLVITPSSTTLSVNVAPALSFSDSVTTVNLHPTVGGVLATDATTSLTVQSNAGSGYQMYVSGTTLTSGSYTIPNVTANFSTGVAAGSFSANGWGFTLGAATNGGSGTITYTGALASSQYVGFPSTAASAISQTGPTNGDTFPLTMGVKVALPQPAGTYSSKVVYTVVPTY